MRSVLSVLGRARPRGMRARLAAMYAVVFLLAGAILLALIYTLVTNVFIPASGGPPKAIPQHLGQLLGLCKQGTASGQPPMSSSLLIECKRAFISAGTGKRDQRASDLVALRGASIIGLGVLTIGSAGLGWFVSGRALRPVRSITEAARQASELRLGQRLALTGPDDELKQLADTFDIMLERLDTAFTSQKRFVANAAHELRTPLTAMRAAIEVTLSKPNRTPDQLEAMAERVKRSVERAEATIEALLTLATSEVGPGTHEPIDLATAAEDALDAAAAAIAEAELEVVAVLDPAHARGDRVLLERMIANLVDNAVRHNDSGGWIRIHTMQQNGGAMFTVTNSGPVVAVEQIPSLFEPFARAAQRLGTSDGVGLGLSIADAIARAHNATIDARPRTDGGLEVTVIVPTVSG
jgi:signal transduction histidine kinase